MKEICTTDRDQIQMTSLDKMVDEESTVRVLDVFVDWALNHDLGFKTTKQITGRPSFPLRTLLGIYIFGYLNRIRSSRELAKACRTNIEMMWLIKGHKPCYKTIANFRKDNGKAFRNLFKLYRSFCDGLELYGKEVIAIDGSKFRAQNSMKNNYNKSKIARHLEYIETKEQEYLDSLDKEDRKKAESEQDTHERLNQLAESKIKYENLKEQLQTSADTQISTTDPDARALPLHMRIVEVGYNLQSAVDSKHNLVVDYEVTNKNDHRALAPMAITAKHALDLKPEDGLTVLADKGYHTGEQLDQCHQQNITTIVAYPRKPKQTDRTKPPHLRKENFTYHEETDTYTCPIGQTLNKQARYRKKDKKGLPGVLLDRYTIKYSICKNCEYLNGCVSKSHIARHHGRYLDRYLTDQAVERNKINVKNNKGLFKKRQAMVEHPFGTIKRQWGFPYTLMKTIPKVKAEFSIIMLCYNLRRTMSILGPSRLKEVLKRAYKHFFQPRRWMKQCSGKNNFYSMTLH